MTADKPTSRTPGLKPVQEAHKTSQQQEQELEKSLEDTFPASDPPSSGSPTRNVAWEEPETDKKKD
jgi:hypothetical protein